VYAERHQYIGFLVLAEIVGIAVDAQLGRHEASLTGEAVVERVIDSVDGEAMILACQRLVLLLIIPIYGIE